MKQVVLALTDDCVQVCVGSPGKSAAVQFLCQERVEHTGDAIADWENSARALWAKYSLPRKHIQLILPGSASSVRGLNLPPMAAKKLPRAVQDELQSREERELVTDYIVLGKDKSGTRRVLACACPRDDLTVFLDLVKRLGLKLDGVTVPLGSLLNLLRGTKELQSQTCIWLWFEGENLISMLVEGGSYRYSGRNLFYSDPGTSNFATEVIRNVSGTLQFRAAERMNDPVSCVYYAGCSESDFEVCIPGLNELGLNVAPLPRCARIRRFPVGQSVNDWLACAGAMLK